uniref:Putative secreted protein n=1 Tax=Anopheles darlingi TaxID=43151 RepID=A0A2M4DGS5_ANODA
MREGGSVRLLALFLPVVGRLAVAYESSDCRSFRLRICTHLTLVVATDLDRGSSSVQRERGGSLMRLLPSAKEIQTPKHFEWKELGGMMPSKNGANSNHG